MLQVCGMNHLLSTQHEVNFLLSVKIIVWVKEYAHMLVPYSSSVTFLKMNTTIQSFDGFRIFLCLGKNVVSMALKYTK